MSRAKVAPRPSVVIASPWSVVGANIIISLSPLKTGKPWGPEASSSDGDRPTSRSVPEAVKRLVGCPLICSARL